MFIYCHYFNDDKKQKGDGTDASLEVVYSSVQTFEIDGDGEQLF